MFITTRSKEVAEIVEGSEIIKRRKATVKNAMTIQKSEKEKNWDYLKKTGSIESRGFDLQRYSTQQKLIDEFRNKMLFGNRCFLIGGGPSLKGFDFSRLLNEFTIAINRAHEFIKDPSVIFFIDEDGFYNELMKGDFGQEALKKFNISRSLKIALNISGRNYGNNVYSMPISEKTEMTFDLKDGLYDGGNSGFAALNLAVCLGAKTIYLLGYDMSGDGKGKQAWFHDGYKKVGNEKNYKDWIKNFKKAAFLLKNRGIRVINLNADSELKCFEFGKLEDIKDLGGSRLYLNGPHGFGDNFYLRSLMKHLSKRYKTVYISTAIPELFWDIPNLKFVHSEKLYLRTQIKHIEKYHKKKITKIPAGVKSLQWSNFVPTYSWYIHHINKLPRGLSERRSVSKFIEEENEIYDFNFSFPLKKEWIKSAKGIIRSLNNKGKKICIIRPPTIRKEWAAYSRNPKIEHIQLLMDKYKEEYFFISIADIEKGKEWFDGELKGIDKEFIHGELPITTIFGLIKLTDMMITYPGFFSLIAIAVRSKCFCIFGGFQKPDFIFDENMGLENFEYITPEPFCDCFDMDHKCHKEIPEDKIIEKFEDLKNRQRQLKEVSVAVPAGLGDIHWILSKLESFKEKKEIDKIKIIIPNDGMNRSDAFIRLIPFCESVDFKNYNFIPNFLYTDEGMRRNWRGLDYAFGFNYSLERGTKLTDILPEYETNFNYPILYPPESKKFAEELKKKMGGKLYLLYGSNNGMFRAWTAGKWLPKDWVKLAIRIFDSTGCRPVLIGAKWDADFAWNVFSADENNVIYDMISKTTIPEVFALIREANILIGFPSGLTILATHFRTPVVMFWSEIGVTPNGVFQKEFKTSWVNPEVLKAGEYIPISYGESDCTPKRIFEKIERFL